MSATHRICDDSVFRWPLVEDADERAVLELLRKPGLNDSETVDRLEARMAAWLGRRHAVTQASGTAALEASFFACGVGPGTEVIGPSLAYWACVQPAARLGATVNFVDVLPDSLTVDVDQVAELLRPTTRAVVAVHSHGRVGDMRRLMEICSRNGTRVIEDASCSVGAVYDDRRAGALGDISAFSMNGKVFAAGEAGMVTTDDRTLWERVLAWGLPHRFDARVSDSALRPFAGLPIGATTSRISNVAAALALGQLESIEERIGVIDRSMTLFADRVDEIRGLRVNRPRVHEPGAMGAWHEPVAFYDQDAAGGASLATVVGELRAAGVYADQLRVRRPPLHTHAWYSAREVHPSLVPYKPSAQCPLAMPVTASVDALFLPRFTVFDADAIAGLAETMKAAVQRAQALGVVKARQGGPEACR